MNFTTARRLKRREVEISLIPLIDLFLNILVFFLVTTTFASDSVFFVDLPEAKPGQSLAERKSISVEIDPEGRISLDRQVLSLGELKARLESVPAEKRASMPVALRADRNSRHGRVVTVLDTIRETGLTNLGIVTQAPKEP